jgi:hypothetical protein
MLMMLWIKYGVGYREADGKKARAGNSSRDGLPC